MVHKIAYRSSNYMAHKNSKLLTVFMAHRFTIFGTHKNGSKRTKKMGHKVSTWITNCMAHKVSIYRVHKNSTFLGQRPLAHCVPAHLMSSARSCIRSLCPPPQLQRLVFSASLHLDIVRIAQTKYIISKTVFLSGMDPERADPTGTLNIPANPVGGKSNGSRCSPIPGRR